MKHQGSAIPSRNSCRWRCLSWLVFDKKPRKRQFQPPFLFPLDHQAPGATTRDGEPSALLKGSRVPLEKFRKLYLKALSDQPPSFSLTQPSEPRYHDCFKTWLHHSSVLLKSLSPDAQWFRQGLCHAFVYGFWSYNNHTVAGGSGDGKAAVFPVSQVKASP